MNFLTRELILSREYLHFLIEYIYDEHQNIGVNAVASTFIDICKKSEYDSNDIYNCLTGVNSFDSSYGTIKNYTLHYIKKYEEAGNTNSGHPFNDN